MSLLTRSQGRASVHTGVGYVRLWAQGARDGIYSQGRASVHTGVGCVRLWAQGARDGITVRDVHRYTPAWAVSGYGRRVPEMELQSGTCIGTHRRGLYQGMSAGSMKFTV